MTFPAPFWSRRTPTPCLKGTGTAKHVFAATPPDHTIRWQGGVLVMPAGCDGILTHDGVRLVAIDEAHLVCEWWATPSQMRFGS